MMIDGFQRKINYARISVTDLCDLRCRYCMPDGVEKKTHRDILTIEELIQVSDALAELGVEKQRVTGGEPLVRRGVDALFAHAGANPLIKTLAVTTNGQTLAGRAAALKDEGVTSVNISIDTLNPDKFRALTKCGDLDATLNGIDAAVECGFKKIKLNAVLLKGVNDDELHALALYGAERNIEVRFIELMPFACQQNYAKVYFISTNEVVKLLNMQKCEKKDETDKVDYYAFPDGVKAGFISPVSDRFCRFCNRIRITADGKLLNCLHESTEYDLKPYVGDSAALKNYITDCVKLKPEHHGLGLGILQSRIMEDIGG